MITLLSKPRKCLLYFPFSHEEIDLDVEKFLSKFLKTSIDNNDKDTQYFDPYPGSSSSLLLSFSFHIA